MYTNGIHIDDLPMGYGAVLIYGICMERYPEDKFKKWSRDIELKDLKEKDPKAYQEEINKEAMRN